MAGVLDAGILEDLLVHELASADLATFPSSFMIAAQNGSYGSLGLASG
jgi:hypothetical protein